MSIIELPAPDSLSGPKKRKSGIPTGNAGEYFVMGELLRRGFDAQLADRNTAGYDLLVGRRSDPVLAKIQVKTVRAQPWYVKLSMFEGDMLAQVTIYVMLGAEEAKNPVRYFIVRNSDVAGEISTPANWDSNGFMRLKTIAPFEDRWDMLDIRENASSPPMVKGAISSYSRPRQGTVKERCFDAYFSDGAEPAVRLGVEQGVQAATVRRWISDWSRLDDQRASLLQGG